MLDHVNVSFRFPLFTPSSVAIFGFNAVALQPGMLDQTRQSLVVFGACRYRWVLIDSLLCSKHRLEMSRVQGAVHCLAHPISGTHRQEIVVEINT